MYLLNESKKKRTKLQDLLFDNFVDVYQKEEIKDAFTKKIYVYDGFDFKMPINEYQLQDYLDNKEFYNSSEYLESKKLLKHLERIKKLFDNICVYKRAINLHKMYLKEIANKNYLYNLRIRKLLRTIKDYQEKLRKEEIEYYDLLTKCIPYYMTKIDEEKIDLISKYYNETINTNNIIKNLKKQNDKVPNKQKQLVLRLVSKNN